MDSDRTHEADLAQRVAEGDDGAFGELYNRYFPRVYDFAIRTLRDREEAALAVQAAFLTVYQELRANEIYPSFEVQLFAAAHRDVADRVKRRRGAAEESEEAYAEPDPVWAQDPAIASDAPELAATVWEVARTARPDEYELLDLSIRQRLNAEELAAVLRTRPETAQNRIGRLQQAFEESFSSLVMLARGRQACLDLDFLIGEEEWSTSLRRRVLRHLQTCQTCQRSRARFPQAANALDALLPVEAPAGWREAMLARLVEMAGGRPEAAAAAPAPEQPARPAPRPATRPEPRPAAQAPLEPTPARYGGGGFGEWVAGLFAEGSPRGPLLALLGGAVLIVAVVLGALCGAGAFDGGGGGEKATTTPTTTGTTTGTPSTTPTLTATLTATLEPFPTNTSVPPTSVPPTPAPPTNTPVPAATPVPPTNTPVPIATLTPSGGGGPNVTPSP